MGRRLGRRATQGRKMVKVSRHWALRSSRRRRSTRKCPSTRSKSERARASPKWRTTSGIGARMRARRESRTRGDPWMSRVLMERGLNAAAELWVDASERRKRTTAKRLANVAVSRLCRPRKGRPYAGASDDVESLWTSNEVGADDDTKVRRMPEKSRQACWKKLW